MSYMEEVAKMLGVELGEYFKIYRCDDLYFLTYDGLYNNESGFKADVMLSGLLSGKYKINRRPCRPQEDEKYYVVLCDGSISLRYWEDCASQINYYKIGNFYRTHQEAEANRNKWIEFYASDEVLEV